jgi:hypothetical protein
MKKLYTTYHPKKCWKPDCNEKTVFIFNFMDQPFPTCKLHAEEFIKVLQETHRIFTVVKERDSE